MPDKLPTVVAYAAGASLAAATLIYVFGPTYFLDDEASGHRKKGAIGLANAANDCFINSVLQALAGLPDLRIYLIRETHRRKLDGSEVYDVDTGRTEQENNSVKPWKLEGLQKGLVTVALKEVLDKLNERPIYRKVISPQPFIRALERAFNTRISRQQQDAQEFLQIVTERLCDEYHAGGKARRQAQKQGMALTNGDSVSERREIVQQFGVAAVHTTRDKDEIKGTAEDELPSTEEGFPFEGKIESQIECLTCGFKPKAAVSTFVTLTLNVPQSSSTSLNSCFDGIFKVEHIEDFKCEYCRLEHALRSKTQELSRASEARNKQRLESEIVKIREALENDPEKPPEGVELPDSKLAPRRRIARHMYISSFPKVLAVHLSRSMFAVGSVSTKNLAKVSFPEDLPLGGLINRKNYKLRGMVTHKGSHNSGHYESFRRQVQPVPYSTPHSFGAGGVYSVQGSPNPSAVQSPRISTSNLVNNYGIDSPAPSTAAIDSPSEQSFSSQLSLTSREPAPTSATREEDTTQEPTPSPTSTSKTKSLRSFKEKAASVTELPSQLRRKPKQRNNRWWRISDDKIKESKTSDVLGMQKEVYLLFYELDRNDPNTL